MPNHTQQILEIRGDPKDLQAFKKFIQGKPDDNEDARKFSLEAILPMPRDIRYTTSPVRIVSEAEYHKFLKDVEAKCKAKWARTGRSTTRCSIPASPSDARSP
jgi:hypothetical protein